MLPNSPASGPLYQTLPTIAAGGEDDKIPKLSRDLNKVCLSAEAVDSRLGLESDFDHKKVK